MHAPASPMDGAFALPDPRDAAPIEDAPAPRAATSDERAPAATDAPRAPLPPSFTADLLADDAVFQPARELRRFGTGLGLSALYGLSLGARQGGKAFFVHAAGVPLALLAVAALGVPALYIALALVDAPIEPPRAIRAASRATAQSGLVLAGLAPAAALFVVTSDLPRTAAMAGVVGLVVGGAIGLRLLLGELHRALKEANVSIRLAGGLGFVGFGVFAIALSARIWTAALPVLGGGR